MVEGARLESVYAGNRIAGSNPVLSAKEKRRPLARSFFFVISVEKVKTPGGERVLDPGVVSGLDYGADDAEF